MRRLWESQGVAVSRLTRVRFGPVTLRRGLHPGHWDELDEERMTELLQAVGYAPGLLPNRNRVDPRLPGGFAGSAARWAWPSIWSASPAEAGTA